MLLWDPFSLSRTLPAFAEMLPAFAECLCNAVKIGRTKNTTLAHGPDDGFNIFGIYIIYIYLLYNFISEPDYLKGKPP